jgi:hypothetical protein
MPLILVIGGIIFFLILVLLIVRFGISKQKPADEIENQTVIHTSGIYSIVRKSPRENITQYKPPDEVIIQYLEDQNVDIHDNELSESDKKALISSWKTCLENSILEVEEGDKKGLEFYYYDFLGEDDVCMESIKKGYYITREDIYAHPKLIPPFHLGCRCVLKRNPGIEDIKDTTKFGMQPFLPDGELPSLPDWKRILKIQQ